MQDKAYDVPVLMAGTGGTGMYKRSRSLMSLTGACAAVCLLLGASLLQGAASTSSTDPPGQAAAVVKRIYIAPDDHTDYVWSADEATYKQAFLDMLDYYLDQADATASSSPEYQGRWNTDGSLWVWVYEKNKPPAAFDRLISRIKDEHITVPLNPLSLVYGGQSVEGILRGMYYPGRLERRYNIRFERAEAMENQTMPYGLGALWAGAGARYTWQGICNCDTLVPDAWDRVNDIYNWVGPDGSKILTKWNSLLGSNQSMGGYAEARNPSAVVDYVDTDSGFRQRYPYDVIGAFGKGWDDVQTLTDEFITTAQTKTTANRRVIVSSELDFFRDFQQSYGSTIPNQSLAYGNEWDLYGAAIAEQSSIVKRSVEKLRAAEALATLVSLKAPAFMASRTAARDQAFLDMGLFFEHDLGAASGNSVPQGARLDFQKRMATEIKSYVDALHDDAVASLGNMIVKSGDAARFYVFNPLSWARTDAADLVYSDAGPVHVVDVSSGQEVPSQIVMVDGQRRLRVLAKDVPSVGYRVFEIRAGVGTAFADAATVSGNVIENGFYKTTMADNGAITSLIDKQRGNREFERTLEGRAINDLGAGTGTIAVENAGPVSVTLLVTSSGPLAHRSRVTLIRDSDRIDIRNDIDENFESTSSWSFGFNIDSPDVRHEEVGAIARARLSSEGGDYSTRSARYDWLTINHFADMSDGSVGVTLSNFDTAFMRLGNSTVSSLDTTTPQISVLAGGRVVNGSNGLPNQGGDAHFVQRFALRTHDAYDPMSAMRFSLEHQNPLVTGIVAGGSGYPGTSYSLLTISDPNVLLWALKPSEEGMERGIIARVWNVASVPKEFSLSFADSSVNAAMHTSHIETDISAVALANGVLASSAATQQIKTYRLFNGSSDTSPPVISGVSASGVTSGGATISWTTDEASDSQIEYGTTAGYESSSTLDPALVTSHAGVLSGLSSSTLYHYRVKSRDAAGNLATSGDNTFTTAASPVLTSITVSPASANLQVGATQAFTATAKDQNGHPMEVPITWSSSNTGVATISATGVATAVSPGTSTITASSASISGTAAVTATLVSGPTAYWKFDEVSGTTAPDSSGHGHTGTVSNAGWVPGRVQNALSFNGTDSSVSAGDIDITPALTISAWIKPSSLPMAGAYKDIVTKTSGGADSNYYLELYGDQVAFGFYNNGWREHATSGADLAAGSWYHLAVTYSDSADRVMVYIDGTKRLDEAETYSLVANDAPTKIGAGFPGEEFSGLIDEVRIYDRALVASEVVADYNAGSGDVTAPVISAISVSGVTAGGATISWTTDEVSDSQVEYGPTAAYGSSSSLDAAVVTSHSQALSGLSSSTLYHYRVKSRDAAGNLATSGDNTFNTAAAPVLTSITVSPESAVIQVGATQAFTATATDQNGNPMGVPITWSSSNTGVATISATGVATGVSQGTSTIMASSGTVSRTAGLTVSLLSGPIAYWKFDETSGTTASDSSGNGHAGTVSGASWVQGRVNNALSFNGTDGLVDVGDIDVLADLTISAWIKPSSLPVTGSYKDIVTKTNGGGDSNHYLEIYGDEVGFGFYNNGWREHTTSAADLAVETWYHVAVTYSDSANRVTIHVNGVKVLDETESYSLVPNNSATKIGAGFSGEEFSGLIDEVKIYSRALSDSEILAEYQGAP